MRCFGPGGVRGDEGQVDVDRLGRGEGDLGLLGLLLQALERHRVLAQVDAVLLAEPLDEPGDDGLVPIVAAEVGVAVGRLDLEDAVADLEDRHVEGAAAEVEDRDLLVLLLVQPVGERGGRGLIDDAQDVEPRDLARILRRLALRVVEVRRDGDDGLGDLLAEVRLGVGLHLRQDEGGNLLGRELLGLVVDLNLDVGVAVLSLNDLEGHVLRLFTDLREFAPDEALCGENGVARIGDGLAFGRLANQALAVLGEGDDRRGGAPALGVRDDNRFAAFHDGHAGVRCSQIYSQNAAHGLLTSNARA